MGFEAGQVIDERYRLLRPIGEGGFGAVWLAEELAVGREVAIKFLRRALDRDEFIRFQREVQALSRLAHDHILILYSVGEHEGARYIITEFVRGETLREWKPRSIDDVVAVGIQLADAISAAHREGIVHRDLKPPNIMVLRDHTGAPFVKVLDFGIAKLAGPRQLDITKTGDVVGTPGFMSPEQLRGVSDIGPATDLYNLGVILWELVEGRPMFGGNSALEISMQHLAEPPPPMGPSTPPFLRSTIKKLLDKDPRRRGTAETTARALRGHNFGPRPEPSSAAPVLEPTQSTRHLVFAAGGVIMLVLLALIAIGLLTKTKKVPEPPRPEPRVIEPQKPNPTDVSDQQDSNDSGVVAEVANRGCGFEWKPGRVDVSSPKVRDRTSVRLSRDDDQSIVMVPENYDARPSPLVLILGDGEMSPYETLQETRKLVELAGRDGAIVVVAEGQRENGAGLVKSFLEQAPKRSHTSYLWTAERLVELPRLIALVESAFCIDPERRFLVGHGRGGKAAELLVARSKTAFVAVATTDHRRKGPDHDGSKDADPFVLEEPIPYLWIAARHSLKLPLEGTHRKDCVTGHDLVPHEDQEAEMREHQGCEGSPNVTTTAGATCKTWTTCDAEFVSCLADGGRRWRGYEPGDLGRCNKPSKHDHGQAIWNFFKRVKPESSVVKSDGCFGSGTGLSKRVGAPHVLLRPEVRDDVPVPLVVLLHDALQLPSDYVDDSPLAREIQSRGWMLFAPASVGVVGGDPVNLPWVHSFEGSETKLPINVFDDVLEQHCVDKSRIYVIGVGRGGLAAERWQSTHGDFAAMATTAYRRYTVRTERGEYLKPIPYLMLTPNTMLEPQLKDWKCTSTYISLREHQRPIREAFGCAGKSRPEPSVAGDCMTWTCDVPYVSCRVDAKRRWYPAIEHPQCDDPPGKTDDYDYAHEILSFFDRVPARRGDEAP